MIHFVTNTGSNSKATPAPKVKAAPITEAQKDLLLAIRKYIAANHISPSYEQLATILEVSKGTVRETLVRLIAKGYISRAGGRYRNLIVTPKGKRA